MANVLSKTLISLLMVFGAFTASAQGYGSPMHAIYGGLGFWTGGMVLGVDYEYLGKQDFGLGGYLRMYEQDEDRQSPGVTTIGFFIRPHFNKKSWDFYVSPGFGIIKIDDYDSNRNNGDDATTLGPSMALGLMYDLGGAISIGVESMSYWVWFEDDYRGQILEDFAMKLRVNF